MVPARPPRRARQPRRATSTSGATRPTATTDARIIFKDFETSNWTWDPVAGAYYWHRFYSHQPDLNFDNPRGAAGDASASSTSGSRWASTACGSTPCPTCSSARARTARTCPRRTTSCGRCARHIDAKFPDRMLLAEANQWPEDAVAYFGDGRRVPHGLPLPADAAAVHGDADGGPLPDHRHPRSRRRRSPTAASGRSSCATTTS